MNIAVIGLGLIGGSIAKGLKHSTPHTVLGFDIAESVLMKAKLFGAVDGVLTDETLPLCDVVIIALYPQDCIDYVKTNITKFKKSALVMDCCGIKKTICDELFPIAKQHEIDFIGAHPMAGIEYSGFDNSLPTLFNNASVILTPPSGIDPSTLQTAKKLFGAIGFTRCEVCTPEHHDRIIAYTSQLAHVVSGAFIKSPTSLEHHGFSAGSYRDMTRVAHLKADMWCELFLNNTENLIDEIDTLISNLSDYKKALCDTDKTTLTELLAQGTKMKELADSNEMN